MRSCCNLTPPLPSLQLIRVNSPDLVLFVGEALVGNEAVDQLLHFNQALIDHSEEGSPRTIDGILLTKFDTVDDKVLTHICAVDVHRSMHTCVYSQFIHIHIQCMNALTKQSPPCLRLELLSP